jgi:hypothetical protein
LLSTLVIGTAIAGAAQACGSGEQGAVAPGGTCEQATDCQEGYVCIPQANGPRQCSNNLAAIQATEEGGAADDAETPEKEAGPPADGGTPTDGTSPQDVTTPVDTGAPQETSTPKETGAPPMEAAPPPMEASTPMETGAPPSDASGE